MGRQYEGGLGRVDGMTDATGPAQLLFRVYGTECGTSGGVDLTGELIERLAREAEEGYAVERLRPRSSHGHPTKEHEHD